ILFQAIPCTAQQGSPVPGGQDSFVVAPQGYRPAAPTPGTSGFSAPVPGTPATTGAPVAPSLSAPTAETYNSLPLNAGTAAAHLEELRNLMPNSQPKVFQEAIGQYCEWLADMADAHWRLSQSFGKADAKGQAESEKQLCMKFGGLKRQAMLLKAEFL